MEAPTKTEILTMGQTIDHIVDAVGDPSISLRRAMILIDIDQYPQTTQTAIGERLVLEKSVVSRNVDWLTGHNCVVRLNPPRDGRESALQTSPFAHKNLQLALRSFGNHHEILKKNLEIYASMFHKHMPSLRELKALLMVGAIGSATRGQVIDNLYNGPATTDQRAIRTLIDEGLVDSNGDEQTDPV